MEPKHEIGHILDLSDHLPVSPSLCPHPSLRTLLQFAVSVLLILQLLCSFLLLLKTLSCILWMTLATSVRLSKWKCLIQPALRFLDCTAPLTLKRVKPQTEPGLNESTRVLRCACRQAERKRVKNKLQISHDLLQECLISYKRAGKIAKTDYILLTCLHECSQASSSFLTYSTHWLILVMLLVLCPHPPCARIFFSFFINKTSALRFPPPQPPQDPSVPSASSAVFHQMEPVSISQLSGIVTYVLLTAHLTAFLPAFLKSFLVQSSLLF